MPARGRGDGELPREKALLRLARGVGERGILRLLNEGRVVERLDGETDRSQVHHLRFLCRRQQLACCSSEDKTILVVDDELNVRDYLRIILVDAGPPSAGCRE
jgi:hypothetical protein